MYSNMKKVFVTGAAGFIGSNLVERLLFHGLDVVGFDNLSTGQERFLDASEKSPKFVFIEGDVLNKDALISAMMGCDAVFHLAANADVRFGLNNTSRDLEQNTIATHNVLEAMNANNIKLLVFSSTGSVYGESTIIPTPENAPFPIQTSLYAASKLACEGLIQAYCEGFGIEGYIFRFVSIVGERYTHGHIFDFYKQLINNPSKLTVLGDGTQQKSYLYVGDCINAIDHVLSMRTARSSKHNVAIYNLGADTYIRVNDSIKTICNTLGVNPIITYTGGSKGWIGDNPFIFLDTTKIKNIGWKCEHTIEQGIVKTLNWLQNNLWIYDKRT